MLRSSASGITTVFDSLRAGELSDSDSVSRVLHELADAIGDLSAFGLLRADHFTHLRCEIATPNVVQEVHTYAMRRPVQLISLMDHTPGQRQFRDLEKMRTYYQRHGLSDDADFAAFVEERLVMHERFAHANRRALVELAHRHGVALASHDDATIEQVEEAIADRVSIAEFPTTIDAARASHEAQIKVMMGAPNLVRGGSHSGNIAAEDLARDGTLEILSSDYAPGSLLMAAFDLPRQSRAYFACRRPWRWSAAILRAPRASPIVAKSLAASEPTSFGLPFTARRLACARFGGPAGLSFEPQAAGRWRSVFRAHPIGAAAPAIRSRTSRKRDCAATSGPPLSILTTSAPSIRVAPARLTRRSISSAVSRPRPESRRSRTSGGAVTSTMTQDR